MHGFLDDNRLAAISEGIDFSGDTRAHEWHCTAITSAGLSSLFCLKQRNCGWSGAAQSGMLVRSAADSQQGGPAFGCFVA
eukprot:822249-Pelagomonas_calceolata.AAC.2